MSKLTLEEQAELSRIHVDVLCKIDDENEKFAKLRSTHRDTLKTLDDRERRIRIAIDTGELPSEQPELPFPEAVKQYVDGIRNNPNIDSVEYIFPGGKMVEVKDDS